jgi:hypothetical protein
MREEILPSAALYVMYLFHLLMKIKGPAVETAGRNAYVCKSLKSSDDD